ncbi:MAG: YitT family protein [Clostridia bacterium]|nr:YitT family protein [Clostridia bacterium]
MLRNIRWKNSIVIVLSSAFLAFGLYHVHTVSGVTEGGVLGLTLLLLQWFELSPAITGFIANALCYLLGWRVLGKDFIVYSAISTVAFAISYRIVEQFPPLWPQLYEMPLAAALLGAVFVGVGTGLCVRMGAAPSGDDALAMSLAPLLRVKIQWVYLISDLLILSLSLTYIPLARIAYSLLTVVLSGQIIGFLQRKKS